MTPRITLSKIVPDPDGLGVRRTGYIDIDVDKISFIDADTIANNANKRFRPYVRLIPQHNAIRIYLDMGINTDEVKAIIEEITQDINATLGSKTNEYRQFVTKVDEINRSMEDMVETLRIEDEIATGVYD